MPVDFECLYFLDNELFCIVEIKLTKLPIYAPKKDRFKWLMINKNSSAVKELHFQSMDSSHAIEERFFDMGYLKFDAEKGVFISKDPKAEHTLDNTANNDLPLQIETLIINYLEAKE
jgi:hypothetical protein